MEKLPKGWVDTNLGEIAIWGSGGTPKRGEKSYYGGNIPWLKTGDLNNAIMEKASEYITEEGLKNSSAKLFPKNSIAIAMYGATIGKTGILGINASTNQACAVAQPHKGIINIFLHYYLKREKQNFIDKGKGGAQPNISQTVIKAHPFPLPPLPEQKRIVAKLDKLFGHLDQLKTRLDKIPQLLKDFRQSILTQAVTGKLTEEWRVGKDLEDVQKMIENIHEERLNKTSSKTELKKIKDIALIEDSIDIKIPQQWKAVSLQKICTKFTYGTSAKSQDEGTTPVIRMGNMQKGKIDWNKLKYTSNPKEIEKYKLSKGDVLFNRTNSPEWVGKTSIYLGQQEAIYAGYLIKIWNLEQLNSYYLNFALNSPYGKQWAWNVKTDGVSQSNINAQKLSKFTIPLPPKEEQKEIVKRVETLFAKADAIAAHYQTLKTKIEHLPQAILAKAFRGELVEQLASDGDAADLLAAIMEEREKGAKEKKTKKGTKKTKVKKNTKGTNWTEVKEGTKGENGQGELF